MATGAETSTAAPSTGADYRIECEPAPARVRVVFHGIAVAESRRAIVMRETRLAPVHYLPREDVRTDLLERTEYRTHCPFKGNASYWTLRVGGRAAENAVWSYEDPLPEAEPVRGYLAFRRSRVDGVLEEDAGTETLPVSAAPAHGSPLVDWLLRDAWEAASIPELLARLSRQLVAVGVPLFRANLMVRTLHPQVMGQAHIWTRDADDVETRTLSHERAREEVFLESPFVPILAGRGGVRRRLEGPDAVLDFPVLRDLARQGVTDYVAMPLPFSDGRIHALTLATLRPGGFATAHLGFVHEILPLVSRLTEVHSLRHTARTLLDTYLGRDTGGRVLEGRIRRGDGEEIPAVVWWCDLRGSTALAERLPRREYLEVLNRFFESSAGSVIAHGGEVLKFIGDAVMAIFPLSGRPDAAARALAAARETLRRVARWNAQRAETGGEPIRVALALHEGCVTYGNVGVAGRLDFTVTGPAVNEVARLEALSKELDRSVVASAAFAARSPEPLVPLGPHSLRGLSEAREVFALEEDA